MSSNSPMQVEDRLRKTNHSSPEAQAKQTGRVLEPPVPSRSESFSSGSAEPVYPTLQRPAEPQVRHPGYGSWTHESSGHGPACSNCILVCSHIEKEKRLAGVSLD